MKFEYELAVQVYLFVAGTLCLWERWIKDTPYDPCPAERRGRARFYDGFSLLVGSFGIVLGCFELRALERRSSENSLLIVWLIFLGVLLAGVSLQRILRMLGDETPRG